MLERLSALFKWLLGPESPPDAGARALGGLDSGIWSKTSATLAVGESAAPWSAHLWPRWIFLRALGLIYFSAFYSLLFQIKGLIGPEGILPAHDYLQAVSAAFKGARFWFAPTLLWVNSGDHALTALCWVGLVASLAVFLNIWPRASLAVCFVCFLSFIGAAQDFASYQSDGMLLEAGILSLFFAPPGILPGLAPAHAPSRASLYLLRWEWFRIYFESGVVKLASGDTSWRHLTAMEDYYQNGPLPTWIGYYVQHFPHWFHTSTTFITLAAELVLPWMLFLPRRFRIACFCILTPFQIAIILTANYAFLNYLVLALGFLLLDDRVVEWALPRKIQKLRWREGASVQIPSADVVATPRPEWRRALASVQRTLAGVLLALMFYCTASQIIWMFIPNFPLPETPVRALAPFRIADTYGLFAVMTHARYEIEFQGSQDGTNWVAYPFRYKPQDPQKAPGIYAPYQPRFEWNLWFASLGSWRQYRFVIWTEERLLQNSSGVLELFAGNPFAGSPPRQVRAVIYQYWFTDLQTKRAKGTWWRRELLGEYAPALERQPDGKIAVLDVPITEVEQP